MLGLLDGEAGDGRAFLSRKEKENRIDMDRPPRIFDYRSSTSDWSRFQQVWRIRCKNLNMSRRR